MIPDIATRQRAVDNLMRAYAADDLECWRLRLAELYGITRHPSVLAAMRLILEAQHKKSVPK